MMPSTDGEEKFVFGFGIDGGREAMLAALRAARRIRVV